MEESLKYKSISYGELAQLYFPKISKKSAAWQLRRWIVANKSLQKNLKKVGFIPGKKNLTPAIVKVLIEGLGEP
ncbi:MAG: hypothetical protein CFE24_15020 [Flavobacterium sp. BFFFF2]|nr:MAG: hypothetical protein CFE24_15020 [Flavobacterium sp. BFFFF2]